MTLYILHERERPYATIVKCSDGGRWPSCLHFWKIKIAEA